MVVKVQLSQATTAGRRQVLVYSLDRSIRYEGDADAELVEAIGDRQKAFFQAEVNDDGFLELFTRHPLPDQGW